jgi:hypothetical protein
MYATTYLALVVYPKLMADMYKCEKVMEEHLIEVGKNSVTV